VNDAGGLFASPSELYQALIFFEITSILRHVREVFVASARINRISGECPIAPLADYVKTQKRSTVMRAGSDDFVCVSWRICRRDQIYG
jgi:hypothetical protein